MSQFSDYLASVDGVAIDVDGNYGPQCWDLWTHYAVNVVGANPWWRCSTSAGGGCGAHPGYTCGLWYGFDASGLNQWFTAYGPGTAAQPGDVAIWDYGYPNTPYSHVAVVVEDRGGSLYTMTQNPGACHYGQITKNGLLGYLRPDNQSPFGGFSGSVVSSVSVDGSVSDLADAVLRGDFGNGPARQAALGARFDEVQAEVNRRLNGEAPAQAPAPSAGSKQREIVPGDTLWDIAAQELGDGSRYMEIFNLSSFRSGNPGVIYPGEIAIIP